MTDREQLRALGLRALAAGFEWAPGVLSMDGSSRVGEPWEGCASSWVDDGAVPDLSDDATLGVLVGQVRRAWGDPTLSVWWSGRTADGVDWWTVDTRADGLAVGVSEEPTEAEALVAALEAAPGVEG